MITTKEKVKAVLGLDDSKDSQIEALIPLVEKDYENIRGKPFKIKEDGDTIYPSESESIAIQMIGYRINSMRNQGVASESLGDHSVSYETSDMIDGYPKSIVSGIVRFVRW